MVNIILLTFSMIFCHIIADYNLQGILANMKQKSWWENNYPDLKYRYDYKVALYIHAFTWSFMVHIPLVIYMYINGRFTNEMYDVILGISVIVNTVYHGIIDDHKANRLSINLMIDQIHHLVQILFTVLVFILIMR